MFSFTELIKNGAIIEIMPHKPEMMDYTPSIFFHDGNNIVAYNTEIGPCDISSVKTEQEINEHFENMIREQFQVNIIPGGIPPYIMDKRERLAFARENGLRKYKSGSPYGKQHCNY